MITITFDHNNNIISISKNGRKPIEFIKIRNITEIQTITREILNVVFEEEDNLTIEKIDEDNRTIVEEW